MWVSYQTCPIALRPITSTCFSDSWPAQADDGYIALFIYLNIYICWRTSMVPTQHHVDRTLHVMDNGGKNNKQANHLFSVFILWFFGCFRCLLRKDEFYGQTIQDSRHWLWFRATSLSVSSQKQSTSFGHQRKWEEPNVTTTEANFLVSPHPLIDGPPRLFFQPYPARAKGHEKMDNG